QQGTAADAGSILDLRAIGLDDQGEALYQETIGDAQNPAAAVLSLRLAATTDVEIAREGVAIAPGDLTVLTFQEPRINRSGDVAFIAQLGEVEPGTSPLEEIRAVVRRADGQLVTVASTKSGGQLGTLSSLSVAGFDDNGTLLLIGSRGSNDRVLILAPSD